MAPSLASRIQARLSRYYGIDEAPAVDDFVRPTEGAEREALLIRETDGDVELALHLPRAAIEPGHQPASLDSFCQVVEGVSHFLYVAERARCELPATRLELELQAEVDKYVVLVHAEAQPAGATASEPRDVRAPALAPHGPRLRAHLYERVTFLHEPGTEEGERYRLANRLAAGFARKLEHRFVRRGRYDEMRAALRRFYRAGQTEKIALARAA